MTGIVRTDAPLTAVADPLTKGEERDFYVALMQQAPLDLDPNKVRYYLKNKKELGADLRAVLGQPLPAFDTRPWQKFFKKYFGRTVDLSNLHVPPKPDYPHRTVVVVPELETNNDVFDACTKAFGGKTWRYINDLNTVVDIVERPDGPYVVYFRDTVEADPEMANKSANDIGIATNTTTLKERIMLELVYFDEMGGHLDIINWTLCAGSRSRGGRVPSCHWIGGKFLVSAADVDYRGPHLRARVVVS